MKRLLLFFLAATLLLSVPVAATAADDDYVTYTYLYDNYARAEIQPNDLTEIVIPSTVTADGVENLTVTEVVFNRTSSNNANYPNLRSITLPSTMTYFSLYNEDSDLPNLEEFKMDGAGDYYVVDGSLFKKHEYSGYAYYSKWIPMQVKKLTLQEGMEDFEASELPSLESLYVPASMTALYIYNCPKLVSFTVADGNTVYSTTDNGKVLVKNGTEITCVAADMETLTVSEGITSVSGLEACAELREITLPSTLTSFSGNPPALERYIMPAASSAYCVVDGVLYSGEDFYIPAKAAEVSFKEDLTCTRFSMNDYSKLTSITFPASAEVIYITNCPALTQFNIPKNVRELSFDCTDIAQIDVDPENTSYKMEDGILYAYDSDDEKWELMYLTSGVESLTIPEDMELYCGRFARYPHLKNLNMTERSVYGTKYVLEDNVIYIVSGSYEGDYTKEDKKIFDAAGGLTTVNIAADATGLFEDGYSSPENCFTYMKNLESITVSEGNKYMCVKNGVLCGNEYWYYEGYGYTTDYFLTALYAPKEVKGHVDLFSDMETYKETDAGYLLNGKIGKWAFYGNDNITSVNLTNAEELGFDAFRDCKNLKSVTLDPGYTQMIGNTFYGCENLSEITPSAFCYVQNKSALGGTAWLAAQKDDVVYLGSSLVSVNKLDMESLDIKEGTFCVAEQSLSGMSGLKSITLPQTLSEYRNTYSHDNLEDITIKSEYITPTFTFENARNLKKVTTTFIHPIIFEDDFRAFPDDLSEVTLVVPEDCEVVDDKTGELVTVHVKEEYAAANEWKRFGQMVASGIKNVAGTDADNTSVKLSGRTLNVTGTGLWSVYGIDGQRVAGGKGNGTASLNRGVYIIKTSGKTCKIAVR